ncbi:hypothetical protein SKAU_G00412900 [Synaphobranchus kaupii]|uniref:Uncharacterized protein n=1 Tax=Synaphobranchus kaupii TaxID=118154 RepID=A0A9Q1E840_SYNKA|nr:hypothetical protein SKAU_G00412900 [Synaphobranchus kaupii]
MFQYRKLKCDDRTADAGSNAGRQIHAFHSRRRVQERIRRRSRRRRLWTRQWLQRRQSQGAYPNLCHELGVEDQQGFQNLSRFAPDQFQKLLEMVTPLIQRQNTNFRDCISPGERLMVTLRFFGNR